MTNINIQQEDKKQDGQPNSQNKSDLFEGSALTQEKKGFRKRWSAWMKQLPRLKFPEVNDAFRIILQEKDLDEEEKKDPDLKTLEDAIKEARADKNMMASYTENEAAIAAAHKRLEDDLEWLEAELEPLFRRRDHEASKEQNRYRIYQLGFMALAAVATFIGSLQALAFADNPSAASAFAFAETVIALYAAYLATLSGRRPPLPKWLSSRQRAEYLRREYFYFLMNLAPYNNPDWDMPERKRQLAQRATNINQGRFSEIAQGGA